MPQLKLPAAFIRGGTSNALVFKAEDLPHREHWDELFLAALGSPDPSRRQLDGMGGGISSLSKVCVVGPPSRPDADIDYTFAQVSVTERVVDYASNCGNMSSAMGPFAVDEGLVRIAGPEARVRVHNTNTSKIIEARFTLDGGRAAVEGPAVIPGVAGSGAPVDLDFLDPGGAGTGRLLPSGAVTDTLEVPGIGPVAVSLIDAANAFCFVAAADVGLTGNELPETLDARAELMESLESIRAAAGVAMGLGPDPRTVSARSPSAPKLGLVAPPLDALTLAGARVAAAEVDLTARMVSMGNVHRALPLTGVLGLAVAARLPGSLPHRAARASEGLIRIATPSGVVEASARVARREDAWHAEVASVRRTQRRLFDGQVYVPASRVPGLALDREAAD